MAPPMVLPAGVPRPLATAGPSISRISTVTHVTSEILSSMIGTWFKKPRSEGTTADLANEKKGFKESDGVLIIEGVGAGLGPGILAKGVTREQGGQHVLNDQVVMPCIKMPGNLEGSGL